MGRNMLRPYHSCHSWINHHGHKAAKPAGGIDSSAHLPPLPATNGSVQERGQGVREGEGQNCSPATPGAIMRVPITPATLPRRAGRADFATARGADLEYRTSLTGVRDRVGLIRLRRPAALRAPNGEPLPELVAARRAVRDGP